MSWIVNSLSDSVLTFGKYFEESFRGNKDLPQHKYLTVPVYKFCVDKIGPIAATGISFLSADLIVHQLLPQTAMCASNYAFNYFFSNETELEAVCNIGWSPLHTMYWACFAIPVMYAKYKRSKDEASPPKPIDLPRFVPDSSTRGNLSGAFPQPLNMRCSQR